ncbi:hypothetical protein FB557_0058 [Marihabitans asiaticum]|uniref:Uncharacterized protein n=2 Tax=Marihabitans asiaticum TaxID=415218 RepID=A0A560WGC5_9MICO|nr:hypothetical protein FB557_0058 [Marihabitans asiaticum]
MTKSISVRAAAAMAGATVLLGGCSLVEDATGSGEESSASSEGSAAGESADGSVTGDESGAKQAGIDLENPPKPIAEVTVRPSGDDDIDSTKIELLELRRDDNVMLATFRLTGDGRGNESKTMSRLLGYSSFEPVFIDMDKLEKYSNVSDLTSSNNAKAPLGEPVYAFTAFPLPRDGVTSMNLQMTRGAPTVDDIPMPE